MKPARPDSSDRGTPRWCALQRGASRLGVLLGAVALFAGLVWGGTHLVAEEPESVDDAAKPLVVAVVAPERATGYTTTTQWTGEVRPRRRVTLAFEIAGRVGPVTIDEGQTIAAEKPLLTVDVTRRKAALREVDARLTEANATLAEMKAGPRKEVLDAARSQVTELEARRALAESKRIRRVALRERKRITAEELDESTQQVVALDAQIAAAKARLKELVLGTREEQIQAQAARVLALEAQKARLDEDIADAKLLAPFAARVTQVLVEEGAVVAAGTPVVELITKTDAEAWIGVPPEDVVRYPVGAKASVRVAGKVFQAEVLAHIPRTDPVTRTQPIVLRLPAEADEVAIPGRLARLSSERAVEAAGWWVPKAALAKGLRGLFALMAVEAKDGGDRVVRHHVEVLHVEGTRALVRGTVDGKTRLLVEASRRVVPGQRVEVR